MVNRIGSIVAVLYGVVVTVVVVVLVVVVVEETVGGLVEVEYFVVVI